MQTDTDSVALQINGWGVCRPNAFFSSSITFPWPHDLAKCICFQLCFPNMTVKTSSSSPSHHHLRSVTQLCRAPSQNLHYGPFVCVKNGSADRQNYTINHQESDKMNTECYMSIIKQMDWWWTQLWSSDLIIPVILINWLSLQPSLSPTDNTYLSASSGWRGCRIIFFSYLLNHSGRLLRQSSRSSVLNYNVILQVCAADRKSAQRLLLHVVCMEESNCEQSARGLNSIKFIDCLLLLHDNNPSLQ